MSARRERRHLAGVVDVLVGEHDRTHGVGREAQRGEARGQGLVGRDADADEAEDQHARDPIWRPGRVVVVARRRACIEDEDTLGVDDHVAPDRQAHADGGIGKDA
jgi:hypothetical protein